MKEKKSTYDPVPGLRELRAKVGVETASQVLQHHQAAWAKSQPSSRDRVGSVSRGPRAQPTALGLQASLEDLLPLQSTLQANSEGFTYLGEGVKPLP